MAPRLFHGSKPPKQKVCIEPSPERPSALPKSSSSIPVPLGRASKIPTQPSSLLPRSKARSAGNPLKSSHALVTKYTSIESEPSSGTASKQELQRAMAAIPTGIQTGMGTRTEISSNPPPPRNRLRRKASAHDPRSKYARSEASDNSIKSTPSHDAASKESHHVDPYPGSILGISMPEATTSIQASRVESAPTEFATSSSRMASYALQQPHNISTTDLTPPTTNFGAPRSSSSSTRYSGSPGPFSRTSTPTSASSHSPGLLSAPKFATRVRPSASPTGSRPPVTRRKIGGTPQHEEISDSLGLPALRESQTSSSSSSSAKGLDSNDRSESSKSVNKISRSRPAPTPPLRISSKKGKIPPSTNKIGPSQGEATAVSSGSSRIARFAQTSSSHPSQPQSKLPSPKSDRPVLPPPRPSRDGIPSLEGLNSSPVIQSNMNRLITTGHKRRESIDQVIASPTNNELSSSSGHALRRSSSATPAPSIDASKHARSPPSQVTSPHLYARDHSRGGETSTMRPGLRNEPLKRHASPRSTSPSKSPSRFGLFSRRIKSPSETSFHSSPSKLTKKGPAAGTGHEGYGRYARRGRSTSTSTAASRTRSTSTDRTSNSVARPASSRKSSFGSNDSTPALDDFLKERLEPVVIGGGGMIRENRNSQNGLYQTMSGQSSLQSFASSSVSASNGRCRDISTGPSSTAPPSQRTSRELLPAPEIFSKGQKGVYGGKSLAHRRSLHRSQLLGETEALRIPPPIRTRALAASPALETYDSTISSAPQTDVSLVLTDDVSEGHEGNWLKPNSKAKTPTKGKQSRRWNFFQRSQRSPERPSTDEQKHYEDDARENVPVAISTVSESRPAAHYAMLDEPDEFEPEQDLEDILRNIEGHLDLDQASQHSVPLTMDTREPSMLLPSPPRFPARFEDSNRPPSPIVPLYQSHNAQTQAIAQAQAVARAQAQAQIQALELAEASVRKPSRLQQVGRIPRVVSKRDRIHNPSPSSFSRPFAQRPDTDGAPAEIMSAVERPILGLQTDILASSINSSHDKPASAPVGSGMIYNLEKEFLVFPRNYSATSGSSSSGTLSLAPITAVTPGANAIPGEDEVWNEYDDLFDHVETASSEIQDILSSFPSLSNIRRLAPGIKLDISTPDYDEFWDNEEVVPPTIIRPVLLPKPDHLTIPVQQALASPASLSELYANYGNRSSTAKSNPRHSTASMTSGSRYSSQTIISRSGSRSSVDSSQAKRVTQVMAEKTYSASSDSLRFSALMTSRWLSFDRVLFSPAQEEVFANRQSSILVLDGLDNDDWATYCALTYPDAMVYNLSSPRSKRDSTESANAAGWITPPNLRRISQASIASPFPFPKGFFSTVVFRFPAIDTANAYRSAIFECKRVLRPGGYLELCVLDMDMVNMGDRARRAVRGVKVRTQDVSPEVSLSPISDTVMKLLGRRGFENINRCVVGVPVAGALSKSRASSMDDDASGSERAVASKTLADLLTGQDDANSKSHYTGARMVARVARWWWTRCYERDMFSDTIGSVWDDKELLKECEERETGLKLVVCYAQKPESIRRRTVSV